MDAARRKKLLCRSKRLQNLQLISNLPRAGTYHLSPYTYCAGDPVNLVDPEGRKIIINDGTQIYTWKNIDNQWGFYDNDNNIYSGDLGYINEYTKALIELMSTNTGQCLVTH